MSVGLKGSWKKTKGDTLRCRLKQFVWEIKYACQRAWYGWDHRDIFGMSGMFIDRYKDILKDYKENRHCLFNVPEEYRDVFNKWHFTDEETDVIIDILIFHLEMMNESYVEKKLYGKNIFDADYDFDKDFSIDKCKHVATIVDQNKELFMELFNIIFWELWD